MAETKAKSALTKAANRLQKAIEGQRGSEFITSVALKLEDAWDEYESECVEDESWNRTKTIDPDSQICNLTNLPWHIYKLRLLSVSGTYA